ncbi:MAG: hypothetical protein P8Y29_10920 [Gemmatimonadota bacterium]
MHAPARLSYVITLIIALFSLLATSPADAQHHPSAREVSPFRPLDLPAPNRYRAADGRPGPAYWQQQVDYAIEATLDPETNVLSGSERITYTNNSPMALPYLWLHLEQNICASNSIANTLDQPPLVFGDTVFDFSCQGLDGGMTLGRIELDGRPLDHTVYGTTMRIDLPEPLASGATIELEIDWSFPVPEYGAGRMGSDGELYEVAWWYPRLAVYDDVKGWNHEPYIGAGEFYLEYGAFDVELTVPARFVVVATGELQNPENVLTSAQRERLSRSMTTDEPVAVITADEAGTNATRPTTDGTLTWHYTADSVRGFAFAMAPNFRWDATSWDGISIQTLYRPDATRIRTRPPSRDRSPGWSTRC